jgi:hypothetical protein
MTTPQKTRDLAYRLLAYEAVAGKTSSLWSPQPFASIEKLHQGLGEFAGVAAFQSLASRALALARTEAPSLSAARVATDGSLQGLGELEQQLDIDKDRPAREGSFSSTAYSACSLSSLAKL